MSDVFEEVNEDIRRDNNVLLWKKYGPWVIGICVFIVLAVGGSKAFESYQTSQAVDASNAYNEFVKAIDKDGDVSKQLAAVEETGHKAYIFLSKMTKADALAQEKNIVEAVKLYDAIALDAAILQNNRDVASIRAAYLMVDTSSLDDIKTRLTDINVVENAFRFQARELIGLSAYKNEKFAEAEEVFKSLTENAQTPSNIRARAGQILSILASKI